MRTYHYLTVLRGNRPDLGCTATPFDTGLHGSVRGVLRCSGDTGTDRIEIHVGHAFEQGRFIEQCLRLGSSLPEAALAAVFAVGKLRQLKRYGMQFATIEIRSVSESSLRSPMYSTIGTELTKPLRLTWRGLQTWCKKKDGRRST